MFLPSTARQIPPLSEVALGDAWAGSSVNCTTYRGEGVLFRAGVTYGAFYKSNGDLAIFAAADAAKRASIVTLPMPRLPFDAHFSPSIGLDQDGLIHVFAGCHVTAPTYFRSSKPFEIESLADCTAEIESIMAQATYPMMMLQPNGDFRLFFRIGRPESSALVASIWQRSSGWSKPLTLISGRASDVWPAGVYINQPVIRSQGRVGIGYVWRTAHVEAAARIAQNIGFDYCDYDPDGHLRAYGGLTLSRPVTPAISERILAVPWGADLSNQAGATTLSDGRPFFVASFRIPGGRRQVHGIWPDLSGVWQSRQLTDFDDDERMEGQGTLGLGNSRAAVTRTAHGLLVLYRSSEYGGRLIAQPLSEPDGEPRALPAVVLIDRDLDRYEPVVERIGTAGGTHLVAYVQSCAQTSFDADHEPASEPASLVTWSSAEIFAKTN